MKAVIIAGGRGERLRPLTDHIPKPMIKVFGKPILEHVIDTLKKNKVTEIVLALCYSPESISKYFKNGDTFGINIQYTYEDPSHPLGTGGAILLSQKLISDTFIVTSADTLRVLDINQMILIHKKSKAIATINVYKHSGHNFKSRIEFDENHKLTKFQEFSSSKQINDGFAWSNGFFYIFEPEIFHYIPKDRKSDLSIDVIPKLLQLNKKIAVFPSKDCLYDIGTKDSLDGVEKQSFLP